MSVQRAVRPAVAATILAAAFVAAGVVHAEPTLRTPKKWGLETALPTPTSIDPYTATWHTMEAWVRDRALWQRNDLLVTLLHDDKYLTIESGKLSTLAPGAIFFVGPAGGGSSGTVFALRVPF